MSITLLYFIIIIVFVVLKAQAVQKENAKKKQEKPRTFQKKKSTSVPNRPRQPQRTKEEQEVQILTRESRAKCDYEAAYSQGKPDRIGMRGDYDPVTPQGKTRIRCRYCNAENFVPTGSGEHYHCYFCWEKL